VVHRCAGSLPRDGGCVGLGCYIEFEGVDVFQEYLGRWDQLRVFFRSYFTVFSLMVRILISYNRFGALSGKDDDGILLEGELVLLWACLVTTRKPSPIVDWSFERVVCVDGQQDALRMKF